MYIDLIIVYQRTRYLTLWLSSFWLYIQLCYKRFAIAVWLSSFWLSPFKSVKKDIQEKKSLQRTHVKQKKIGSKINITWYNVNSIQISDKVCIQYSINDVCNLLNYVNCMFYKWTKTSNRKERDKNLKKNIRTHVKTGLWAS